MMFNISAKTSAASSEQRSDPKWVKEMRKHHEMTGSYRLADVTRVLGDPRVSVQSSPDRDAARKK